MNLDDWVALAASKGASDLHLEAESPVTVRVRGRLYAAGPVVSGAELAAAARGLFDDKGWKEFQERRSADLSRGLGGVRVRINVFRSARGASFAIRIFQTATPTLRGLNLHPDLGLLAEHEHGLVLLTGPTGSGKSSTLAALVQSINESRARHILTIERPIEYSLRPRKSLLRQRQVGRDTPSFADALRDALREDPDVIVVGEMRSPETMRLVLNAAETGHLVFATMHSSNAIDALARVVSSFPAEIRPQVSAQLAEVLRGVVSQRLAYRPELGIRVAECEVLLGTHAARNLVRNEELFKLAHVLEMGAADGMWTFERYRRWLDAKNDWVRPEIETADGLDPARELGSVAEPGREAPRRRREREDDVIVLQPSEESIQDILSELDEG
jgi:twitching motility protein PilT